MQQQHAIFMTPSPSGAHIQIEVLPHTSTPVKGRFKTAHLPLQRRWPDLAL